MANDKIDETIVSFILHIRKNLIELTLTVFISKS